MIAVPLGPRQRTAIVASPAFFERHGKPRRQTLLIEAALDGCGIAFAFESQVTELIARGKLVRVLEDWYPYYGGFYLYYPGRRQVPTTLRAAATKRRASTSRRGQQDRLTPGVLRMKDGHRAGNMPDSQSCEYSKSMRSPRAVTAAIPPPSCSTGMT
jgi:hypothetical protein